MTSFTSEDLNIHIFDDGLSARDFMDQRIEELSTLGNKDAFHTADLGDVLEKHLHWVHNFPRIMPFYAVKCNDSRPIIAMLGDLGTCFDCASQAEIQLILSLGIAPSRIIYANPCKQDSHIRYASFHGVQMMTFDCEEELTKIAKCHGNAKLVLRIAVDDSKAAVRLSSKFGAPLSDCHELFARARELCLEVIGVSFHVGSNCKDPQAYGQAISDAGLIFNKGVELGFNMTLLDIGGGFPGSKNFRPMFEEMAAVINSALDDFLLAHNGVKVIAEPGRFYVASAYTSALSVIGKKVIMEKASSKNDDDEQNTDKTIMYYVNDGIHGSFNRSDPDNIFSQSNLPYLHKKLHVPVKHMYNCVIWGPTCDSSDSLVKQCVLPELEVGDWLLVDNMGAYTCVLGTNFNGFKKGDTHFVMSRDAWQRMQQVCSQGIMSHHT